MQKFTNLVQEAIDTKLKGWDLSFFKDRVSTTALPWSYKNTVLTYLKKRQCMLDMGTGGGEFLSMLQPLPLCTYVTEGYEPNVSVARKLLEPLGVKVYHITDDNELPCDANFCDLISNHHESFSLNEISRILKPGGFFITQQVGKENNLELNKFFHDYFYHKKVWDLSFVVNHLKDLPFTIHTQQEARPEKHFYDIGAVVFYLKMIPWQIKGFQIEKNIDRLRELHEVICQKGSFKTHAYRFFLILEKL